MQEADPEEGECSHIPRNGDVSDVSIYEFSDYDMEDEYNDVNVDHESTTRTKWDEKNIQATSDLAGDPLNTRKTRSHLTMLFPLVIRIFMRGVLSMLDMI